MRRKPVIRHAQQRVDRVEKLQRLMLPGVVRVGLVALFLGNAYTRRHRVMGVKCKVIPANGKIKCFFSSSAISAVHTAHSPPPWPHTS
jgi:hypothetical protein